MKKAVSSTTHGHKGSAYPEQSAQQNSTVKLEPLAPLPTSSYQPSHAADAVESEAAHARHGILAPLASAPVCIVPSPASLSSDPLAYLQADTSSRPHTLAPLANTAPPPTITGSIAGSIAGSITGSIAGSNPGSGSTPASSKRIKNRPVPAALPITNDSSTNTAMLKSVMSPPLAVPGSGFRTPSPSVPISQTQPKSRQNHSHSHSHSHSLNPGHNSNHGQGQPPRLLSPMAHVPSPQLPQAPALTASANPTVVPTRHNALSPLTQAKRPRRHSPSVASSRSTQPAGQLV